MPKILYLEDKPLDAKLVNEFVTRKFSNAEIVVVHDPAEFLKALNESKFDAVLCDNSSPDFNSLQALEAVKSRDPEIPVILLSAQPEEKMAIEALSLGALDYVSKSELWRLNYRLGKALNFATTGIPIHSSIPNASLANLLIKTIQELSTARTSDDIAQIVGHSTRRLVNADGATLVFLEGENCFYVDENAISPLFKGGRYPIEDCISGWVMLNREQAIIPNIFVDNRIPHEIYRKTFVKSLVMSPVRRSAPVAAIGAYWAELHQPTEEEILTLQILADSTSLAIENVNLYNDLELRIEDRTNRLVALNRELEVFAHRVSHDLRGPLESISGLLNLLLEEQGPKLEPDFRDNLQLIGNECARLSSLVSSLLKLAKLAATAPSKEILDVTALCKRIVERQHRIWHHTFTCEIEEGMTAYGDGNLIEAALENLISNACKFSSKVVNPLIQIGHEAQCAGRLNTFHVRDNGAGFEQTGNDLFGVFKRFHNESDFEGTGIGLATVKRIIEKHQGEIWAESAPGKGSTFSFSLPAKGILGASEN